MDFSKLATVAKVAGKIASGAAKIVAGVLVQSILDEMQPKKSSRKKAPPQPPRARAPRKKVPKAPPPWWKVLQVSEAASVAEIKAAYRKLMNQTHPDKVAHLSPKLRKVAEDEAKLLNGAYEEALRVRNA